MKMKKFAAILFSAAMMLNMGTAAFAEGEGTAFSFTKTYKTTAGETPAVIPAETLSFTVTADTGNPDGMMITVSDAAITDSPQSIIVGVPEYTKVGKYNYTVTEQTGSTQGVIYANTSFGVQVLVTNDADGDGKLDKQVVFTTSDGNQGKIDGIVNTYDLGSLNVSKEVSGNLASSSEKFDIDVTFSAQEGKEVKSAISYGGNQTIAASDWVNGSVTVTISIGAGEDVTFSNIPAGVTYTVAEQAKHAETDANGSDGSKGYTVSYTNSDETKTISADDADTVKVTNTKGTTVDTGINLDSMPYIMILCLVAVCAVVMFVRKRFSANR